MGTPMESKLFQYGLGWARPGVFAFPVTAWRWLAFVLLELAFIYPAWSEISSTNRPFPGIAIYSETRPQPPTRLFVAEIDLTNPKVRLRVSPGGPDPDGPGEWQTTLLPPTRIAARENMDLVVNGDFFRVRGVKNAEGTSTAFRAEGWSAVSGPAVTDGKAWAISNARRPCLVVSRNREVTIEMRDRPNPEDWEVVAGNTMLVDAGVAVPHANQLRHPRTVVGLDAKRTRLLILVVDGRKPGTAMGMSYDELAAEMIRLGCRQALNLDGGGSSVMAIRDPATREFRLLNAPTDGRERAVANALGVSVDNGSRVRSQPK
jgi:Phosphodiester glycosidase